MRRFAVLASVFALTLTLVIISSAQSRHPALAANGGPGRSRVDPCRRRRDRDSRRGRDRANREVSHRRTVSRQCGVCPFDGARAGPRRTTIVRREQLELRGAARTTARCAGRDPVDRCQWRRRKSGRRSGGLCAQRRPGERSRRQGHSVHGSESPVHQRHQESDCGDECPASREPPARHFVQQRLRPPMVRERSERQQRRRHYFGRRSGRLSSEWCARSGRRRRVHGDNHQSKRNVNRRVDQRCRRNGARDEISGSVDQSRIFCGARRRQRPAGARSKRCRSARAARLVHADRGHQHRRG